MFAHLISAGGDKRVEEEVKRRRWIRDGNKSLYLVFMGVVFFQHLGLLLEQLGQHLGLLLDQLGQQHLGCFVSTAGQQHLDCFLEQQLASRTTSSLAS
jgi:hypothetical protein